MKIQELLSDDSKWTQRANARAADTTKRPPRSPEAMCWCLVGAFLKCYAPGTPEYCDANLRLSLALQVIDRKAPSVADWNDKPERTFKEVQALIKKADI